MHSTPDITVEVLELDCPEMVADMAQRCRELWYEALHHYWIDCQQAARGGKDVRADERQALRDLLGSREMLRQLCQHVEIDADRAGWAMLDLLTRPSRSR